MDVKICGLTNYDDAMVAIEAGADYLGFVLYPKSPRGIRPLALAKLAERLSGHTAGLVAVVVNESVEQVRAIAGDCNLSAAQIHGDERAEEFVDGVGVPLWRAVKLMEGQVEPTVEAWTFAERYVVDAAVPGEYGGTGERADWEQARLFAQASRAMLAGGLTSENVAEAIAAVSPWGVDVSSGVEREPGRKDWPAVRRFVREAKRLEEPRMNTNEEF